MVRASASLSQSRPKNTFLRSGSLMARGRPKIPVPPCKFCNMQFKRVEHLQRHERIHTQQKPFFCDCGHSFTRQDLLMRHRRRGHPESHTEATTVSLSQKGTPTEEQRQYENHDSDSSRLPSLVPNSEPVEQCSVISRAPVSEIPYNLSRLAEFQPPDQTTSLSLDSTYEFELLWNNSNGMTDFLPATFFDIDYSLSDLWQTYNPRLNGSTGPHPQVEKNRRDSPPRSSESGPSFISLPSRLPLLEPDSLSSHNERLPNNDLNSTTGFGPSRDAITGLPWDLSAPAYERISIAIRSYQSFLPNGFLVSSKHTISRYIEGYFRGFHEHFPFLHPATLKVDTLAPELLLAMMAMGAFCRVEKRKGYELYFASKAIITHHLEQRIRLSMADLARSSPNSPGSRVPRCNLTNLSGLIECDPHYFASKLSTSPTAALQTLQSLIILVAMATWADVPAVRDALAMGSQLSIYLKIWNT